MNQKGKRYSGLHGFLAKAKVLDSGDAQQLQEAKSRYWNAYKNAWKKSKRLTSKRVEVWLTSKEYVAVKRQANKQRLSVPQFIKQASIEGSNVVSKSVLGSIRALLFRHYQYIEETFRVAGAPQLNIDTVLLDVLELEKHVLDLLRNGDSHDH